jgi:hypothetical protein
MPSAAFAYRPASRSYPNDQPPYLLRRPLGLCLLPRFGPLRSIAQVESDGELCPTETRGWLQAMAAMVQGFGCRPVVTYLRVESRRPKASQEGTRGGLGDSLPSMGIWLGGGLRCGCAGRRNWRRIAIAVVSLALRRSPTGRF